MRLKPELQNNEVILPSDHFAILDCKVQYTCIYLVSYFVRARSDKHLCMHSCLVSYRGGLVEFYDPRTQQVMGSNPW